MTRSVTAGVYTLLQIPAAALSFWSFKLRNAIARSKSSERRPILLHDTEGGILGAGVCHLGTFGAIVMLIWIAVSVILLWVYAIESYSIAGVDAQRIVAFGNIALFGIVFTLSLVMNFPLCVRTIPFYCIQTGIVLMLLFMPSTNS